MASIGLSYHVVDVFTTSRFLGNPLAVVHVPVDTNISQDEKQRIAAEFNLSETVFLHYPSGYEYATEWPIDIFTTASEIPFAGHPTIGTSSLLSRITGLDKFALIAKAGRIGVTVEDGNASLAVPHNMRVHAARMTPEDLAAHQPKVRSKDSFPVVSIVKGMTFAMIRLNDDHELDQVATTSTALGDRLELDEGWTPSIVGAYFYTEQGTGGSDTHRRINSRMILETLEDPATGSAASGLCGYLAMEAVREHSPLRGKLIEFTVTQGEKMGRKSDISVQVKTTGEGAVDEIVLCGTAVPVMSGKML